MMLIAACGTIAFSHGLFAKIAWLHMLHLPALIAIDAIALALVARRSVAVFHRYAFSGLTRPRWWFELGRAAWIVAVVCFATAFGSTLAIGQQPAPAVAAMQDFLFISGMCAIATFLPAATLGYCISFARRLPRRGKAFECVQYFYGMFVASALAALPILLVPNPNQAALVAWGLAAVAVFAAIVVALVQRVTPRMEWRW